MLRKFKKLFNKKATQSRENEHDPNSSQGKRCLLLDALLFQLNKTYTSNQYFMMFCKSIPYSDHRQYIFNQIIFLVSFWLWICIKTYKTSDRFVPKR